MLDLMSSRFGGSWDGDPPEIHGLIKIGGRKLKVEVLLVEATGQWQSCVFDDGSVVSIEQGSDPVEVTARALSGAL